MLTQRFGSAAKLGSQPHGLVLDGVYRSGADGARAFVEVAAPSEDELQALPWRVITWLEETRPKPIRFASLLATP